jgi:hypothetical protein
LFLLSECGFLPGTGFGPHNGMVRRGFLEVVEFEEGGSHETTCGRD